MANYTLVETVGGVEFYEGSGTFDGNATGKDNIVGSDGIDTISSGNGEDSLFGEGGNDSLNGGNADDSLTGGTGDDTLTGGNGADTFNYSFTMTSSSGSGPQSYADYLGSLGITLDSQNVFSTSYSAWLNYLVFGGNDTDGNAWEGLVSYFGWEGEVTVGLNQNDYNGTQPHVTVDGVAKDLDDIFGGAEHFSWTKGKAIQTRTFWDLNEEYDWGGETAVSSTDGKDTIVDFDSSGDDADKLFFTVDIDVDPQDAGFDEAAAVTDFKSKFVITTGDFDSDTVNDDTRMVLDGDTSITLLGYAGGDAIWDHVEFEFV